MKLSCPCGQVRIETSKAAEFINECNCTLCSRAEASWAYFHPSEVVIDGATKGYSRDDKTEPAVELQSCEACGATTHFVLTPSAIAKYGNVQLGVNARLADKRDLAGVELRYPDGAAWSGQGGFGYVREARILGR